MALIHTVVGVSCGMNEGVVAGWVNTSYDSINGTFPTSKRVVNSTCELKN